MPPPLSTAASQDQSSHSEPDMPSGANEMRGIDPRSYSGIDPRSLIFISYQQSLTVIVNHAHLSPIIDRNVRSFQRSKPQKTLVPPTDRSI